MAEETFDLATPTGPVRPGVDQGDVERGADDLQVVGAEGGSVVAVEPPRQAAAQQRLLQSVLEAGGILGQVEGGKRHHARGIVEEGVEVGLAAVAPSWHQQTGPVHQVRGPQIVDVGIGEGQCIGLGACRWLGRRRLGGEEAVYGAARQPQGGLHAAGQMQRADQAVERSLRTLGAQLEQQLLHRLRDRAGPPGISSRPWLEPLKPVGLIQLDPVAHRRAADASAPAARDRPLSLGNGAQQLLLFARRKRAPDQLGHDAVAKQRDLLSQGLIHGTKSPESGSGTVPKPPAVASWQNQPVGSYQPMERPPMTDTAAARGGKARSPRRESSARTTTASAAAASATLPPGRPPPAPPATTDPTPGPATLAPSLQTAPRHCAASRAPAAHPGCRPALRPQRQRSDSPLPDPPPPIPTSDLDRHTHPPATPRG